MPTFSLSICIDLPCLPSHISYLDVRTGVRVLGADLSQPVPRALVGAVQGVRAEQGLEGGADGHQQQLGVEVTRPGGGGRGQLTERRLHRHNARGQDLEG